VMARNTSAATAKATPRPLTPSIAAGPESTCAANMAKNAPLASDFVQVYATTGQPLAGGRGRTSYTRLASPATTGNDVFLFFSAGSPSDSTKSPRLQRLRPAGSVRV